MAKQQYAAVRYAADGHAGEQGDGEVIARGSIEDCRQAIALRIRGSLDAMRWSGTDSNGDIEAYCESDEEGCGGYAVTALCPICGEPLGDYGYDIGGILFHQLCVESGHVMVCSECGGWTAYDPSRGLQGWQHHDDYDLCPQHAQ